MDRIVQGMLDEIGVAAVERGNIHSEVAAAAVAVGRSSIRSCSH